MSEVKRHSFKGYFSQKKLTIADVATYYHQITSAISEHLSYAT